MPDMRMGSCWFCGFTLKWYPFLFSFSIKFILHDMENLISFLLKTHMRFSCRGRLDSSVCLLTLKYFLFVSTELCLLLYIFSI